MQTKKVVDWIKFKNLKDATINYSALQGLNRINKLLSRFIKYGLLGFIIIGGSYIYYKRYCDIISNGVQFLEKQIHNLDDKQIIYLKNHIRLSLDYAYPDDILKAEDKIGITYYRQKLLRNASGLVIETCKYFFIKKAVEYFKIVSIIKRI